MNESTKEECPRCGNQYTHKKNCTKQEKPLDKDKEWSRDPRKDDPEIRELLNTEALEK